MGKWVFLPRFQLEHEGEEVLREEVEDVVY